MATLTVKSALASVANGAYLECRPPAGESWLVTSVAHPNSGGWHVYNGSVSSNDLDYLDGKTQAGARTATKWFINNSVWVRAYNSSGSTQVMGIAGILAPTNVTTGSSIAAVAAGSTLDIRPASGYARVLNRFVCVSGLGASWAYTNGTDVTAVQPLNSDGGGVSPLTLLSTNGVFVRFKHSGGVTYNLAVSACDLPTSIFNPTVAMVSTPSASYMDVRPPSGEVWKLHGGGLQYPYPYMSNGTLNAGFHTTVGYLSGFIMDNSLYFRAYNNAGSTVYQAYAVTTGL